MDDLPHIVDRFYRRHRRELFTYALALTQDACSAEDAVQTAICGLLSRRKPPRELRPFVFRSVRNAAIDWIRASKTTESECQAPAVTVTPPGDRRRLLEQLLEQIPPETREVLVLKEVVGMTFREIGMICRKPLPTVAARYRRGITTLRHGLGLEDEP